MKDRNYTKFISRKQCLLYDGLCRYVRDGKIGNEIKLEDVWTAFYSDPTIPMQFHRRDIVNDFLEIFCELDILTKKDECYTITNCLDEDLIERFRNLGYAVKGSKEDGIHVKHKKKSRHPSLGIYRHN